VTTVLAVAAGVVAVALALSAIRATRRARTAERLATTDPLTGLPNRRELDRVLHAEGSRAARSGGDLCVAFVDLDGFKAVNDRGGHRAGDALLATVAADWAVALRPYDLLARHGGDEFVLVLPDCTPEGARRVVERLRACVPATTGISAGITAWRPGDDPTTVIERADGALRRAKAAGGGRTELAD
jgi:diguanylate cyclase (GGDEF)-like protein